MHIFNIENSLKLKKERKWDTLYVVVDAHGTMIKPYHTCIEFYPDSVEVLKWFSDRKDFKLILWSSSYTDDLIKILEASSKLGINFDAVNRNNFENDTETAYFLNKFYFNILLDDKAGFDPDTDWKLIKQELIRLGEWDIKS